MKVGVSLGLLLPFGLVEVDEDDFPAFSTESIDNCGSKSICATYSRVITCYLAAMCLGGPPNLSQRLPWKYRKHGQSCCRSHIELSLLR